MASKSTSGSSTKKSTKQKSAAQPIPINSGNTGSGSSADNNSASLANPKIQEEIRQRAYEIYEERGRHDGLHHDDWARAEAEVLSKYQKQEKSA